MTDGHLMDLVSSPLEELPHVHLLTQCLWCGSEGWPFEISTARNGCGDIMMIFVCCPCCALDDEEPKL